MMRLQPLLLLLFHLILLQRCAAEPWKYHTIDGSSRGADGVKLADVNGDRLLDMTTGWEEGGITRVYLHPGYQQAKQNWPAVTISKTDSVEDAVFADLDDDGATDVITSCEGKNRQMFIHWAPENPKDFLKTDHWQTTPIPVTKQVTSWMYAQPLQVDGKHGLDLIVGSKGQSAMAGWLQAPADPRDINAWQLHKLYSAGWIMSLITHDLDRDGDADIILSDRRGKTPGILWLENPGNDRIQQSWREHRIGAHGREVMFIDAADWNGDGRKDIVAAVKPYAIHWYLCPENLTQPWKALVVNLPNKDSIGTAKAVRVTDIDADGKRDVVFSCERAQPPKQGLFWLSVDQKSGQIEHQHEISGEIGIKFDHMEIFDVDGDGDLDVLTCEERHQGRGLGVVWFENPHK